ncbi:MAG: aminoglycoside phosphotransferase family protein [Defluviitaleaceae bacterium]|nr:aminoglycoside phosphotransferase family protein [Defluviitaleaceae bacterium]MCL2274033.1 aminoglycoside phosphotransferase family protein [Defluviitaleaceae bacterium]MCL2274066.1 aminoglycoside phosphotransferase family protein [Defluviitaleaceae bacterium]
MKIDTGYTTTALNQGAVGFVERITGTRAGKPFNAVLKTQKKWERQGDPLSWRREYDLYTSGLGKIFTNDFRIPECYHAEINENETKLWIEYVEGTSGADLTIDMYEKIAEGLGRFHGKMYAENAQFSIKNLADPNGMKNYYHYNRTKGDTYNYIRSAECKIPQHLCKMIIEMDEQSDKIWEKTEQLPQVLRHGDFFPPNIFYKENEIILIDWDSAGLAPLGEDIVCLIADNGNVENMADYYRKCVPAYMKGFSAQSKSFTMKNLHIYERIVMHYSYRLLDNENWRGEIKPPTEQENDFKTLQKIYEMGGYNEYF